MENEAGIYAQHIRGRHNIIADSLSRDFHIPTKQLTVLLTSLFPQQLPQGLRLTTLPGTITSWVASLTPYAIKPKDCPTTITPSCLGASIDGNTSWPRVTSMMNSLKATVKHPESVSCARLQALSEEIISAKLNGGDYAPEPSVLPLRGGVRSLGRPFGTPLPSKGAE